MPTSDPTQPRRLPPRVVTTLMGAGGAHTHAQRLKPGALNIVTFYTDHVSVALEDRDLPGLRQLLTDAVAQLDAIDGGGL